MVYNTFGTIIRNARLSKDLSLRDLSKIADLDYSFIGRLEKSESSPSRATIEKLSKALDISEKDLLISAGYLPYSLSDIPIYSNKVADITYDYSPANLKLLPVLGVIRAGYPLFAEENIIGYEPSNEKDIKNGDYFYLKVTGDSMIGSGIKEGSLVLVKKQDYVEDGQVAVVLVDSDEATLKRVYRQDKGLLLQADNPKYPPAYYKAHDVKIIGWVLKFEQWL